MLGVPFMKLIVADIVKEVFLVIIHHLIQSFKLLLLFLQLLNLTLQVFNLLLVLLSVAQLLVKLGNGALMLFNLAALLFDDVVSCVYLHLKVLRLFLSLHLKISPRLH